LKWYGQGRSSLSQDDTEFLDFAINCVNSKKFGKKETPMADTITPEVSYRICKHMNDDHADAVLLYAKAYGHMAEAEAAQILKVDPEGMDLAVNMGSQNSTVRITFDHVLQDSEDAHQTLIAMVKTARSQMDTVT
jgi:putative heme iron utilization protein